MEKNKNKNDQEIHLFKNHLTAIGKLNYAKGSRPPVDCIFCAVRDNNPDVESMKVYEDEILYVCLNLYPYNSGHLMVVPNRHIEDFNDLTSEERNWIFEVVISCQKLLDELFTPTGFNVGYNQGDYSGASVKHIHVHVVPRYNSELGFIDIIGGTKVIIETLSQVYEKIKPKISDFIKPIK